ncbi:MAG TPA: hypothetical protein VHU13_09375 [Solirubrobacteraceae bacterium]|jgi:hypothetical protein|nr:hypothetical protein [Solirubrobacteraceae bacterium]
MRKRLIVALVAFASCGAIAATPAAAVEYANHVEVGGGGNHFGPYVYFYAAETFPWGTAIACAGVRGVGLNCAAKSGETAVIVLPFDVEAEPYIHNHSTWTSYFNGYYYK